MGLTSFVSYLSLEKNYSPLTVGAYEKDISAFVSFCKENYEIDSVDEVAYTIIRSWIVSMVDDSISNRSINRKIAALKAYYKFLLKIEKINKNPLAKHKALKTDKKIEVPFSEAEMTKMLLDIPFADDFEGVRDKLMIDLLYTTGIRRAELINLKLSNISVPSKTVKVLGKRNKERIIPLLAPTLTLLGAYIDKRKELDILTDKTFLFLSKTGNKIYETLVYRVVNGYFSKVSSKTKKSPHILRHTFATHLLNKGADLNSVKELLGHSSLASTQVYTHNSIAELKKVHVSAHPRSKK